MTTPLLPNRDTPSESGQPNEPTHIARAYACQFAKRINSRFHATKSGGSAGKGKDMNKVNGQSDQVVADQYGNSDDRRHWRVC
jgi:hypothetical protein